MPRQLTVAERLERIRREIARQEVGIRALARLCGSTHPTIRTLVADPPPDRPNAHLIDRLDHALGITNATPYPQAADLVSDGTAPAWCCSIPLAGHVLADPESHVELADADPPRHLRVPHDTYCLEARRTGHLLFVRPVEPADGDLAIVTLVNGARVCKRISHRLGRVQLESDSAPPIDLAPAHIATMHKVIGAWYDWAPADESP